MGPRDRCRLPAPSWCDGGRALSGALHTDAQACATELAKRRLPSASLVSGLPTDSKFRRLDPNHRTQDSPKTRKKPPTTKRTRLGVLRALIFLSSNASLLPVHRSAPPSSSCGKLREKGRCPLAPSPRGARGPRESLLGPSSGRFIPQNEAPPSHDL